MGFAFDWLPNLMLLRKGHLNGYSEPRDLASATYNLPYFPLPLMEALNLMSVHLHCQMDRNSPSVNNYAGGARATMCVRLALMQVQTSHMLEGGFSYLKSMNKGVNMYKSPCSSTGHLCSLMQ